MHNISDDECLKLGKFATDKIPQGFSIFGKPLDETPELKKHAAEDILNNLYNRSKKGVLTGSLDDLSKAERKFAEKILDAGRDLEVVPRGAGRSPDFKINGVVHELKTVSGVADATSDSISSAISNRVMNGRGQASNIVVDTRGQAGMTLEIAERAIKRAFVADNAKKGIQSIRIIGPGFDLIVPRI